MWRASRITTKLRGCNSQSGARCRLSTKPEEPVKPTAAAPPIPPRAAPGPTPPPPKKGGVGGFLFKLLGVGVVGGGAVVGVTWYDPTFRETVLNNVPYADQILPIIYQYLPDNSPKPKSGYIPIKKSSEVPAPLAKLNTSTPAPPTPEPLIPSSKPEKKPVVETKKEVKPVESTAAPPAPPMEKVPDVVQADAKLSEEAERKRKQEEMDRLMQQREAEEAAEIAATETIVKDMLESCMVATRAALEAEKSAAEAIAVHTGLIKRAMEDESQTSQKEQQWEDVAAAYEKRDQAVETTKEKTNQAIMMMEKLNVAIQAGKENKATAKSDVLIDAQQSLGKMTYDLNTAMAEHKKADSDSKLMSDYKALVEKGKDQFQKELASIMPDVKIGRKGKKLSEEELNSLIAHAHRRIEQLQRHLAEQQVLEEQRTEKVLRSQKNADEILAKERVGRELEKLKTQFLVQKEKMEKELSIHFEAELRQQLMRQAAAHSDHLAEVLKVQQNELQDKFEEVLRERLVKERDDYHLQVATWVARLKGIEAAIDGRAEMEKQGRKAQELWLATQSLQTIIRSGATPDPEEWEDQLLPLSTEFESVRGAASEHPYVSTVIESVPDVALKRGVYTEEALHDRFNRVQRVCKRVSMIGESGAPLYKYLLSYLQSIFIFSAARPLNENEEVDSSKLSTFVLLDNARYCLEKGELEQAVRYVNQLQGLPRKVASDWLKEAILLLETKQAADALLAYASASGLGALF